MRRLAGAKALAACLAAGGAGAAVWAAPPASDKGAAHPPPGPEHSPHLRRVGSGEAVPPADNPGVRVFPGLLSDRDAAELLRELQPLKARHGANLISPAAAAMYRFQQSYLGPAAPPVNMLRITGRPEMQGQLPPAWGYGDAFDRSKLPPALAALAARIEALPGLRLGPLRDVTINCRHHHFYRLDPHLDPALDGENVFIVSVDSGTVLTLCPLRWLKLQRAWEAVRGALTLEDERELVRRQAEGSWTGRDVDVRADARGGVLLSGDARWNWTHGTRLGVQLPGRPGLHDWFGRRDDVVPRGAERHSVVFAFAAGEPDGAAAGAGRGGGGGGGGGGGRGGAVLSRP
ncbi:hypothetical protein Rsub_05897 [Raphidocelis subcapitata]|uniref:Uncharacterized protein n=1 Tax=Raphidocelis subcapitata TaxID=307507 RepID=A0A2V0NZX4_9CHLO|nr:hypothetical protein Rsub_05897 [Raphidocelis subcapitata]|eukprot:GBF93166.1 hypothetical protein Rsub_05897 [Raphidocelis subcapitata]